MTELAWIERIAPAYVRSLDVYQPGKPIEELERELGITGAIKVASNENPLGPSPRALAAVAAALPQLHLYPDAGGFALRRALSESLGRAMPGAGGADGQAHGPVPLERIGLGAGSNELLYQLVLATCEPDDEVLSHEFAFLSYRLAAAVSGRRFVAVPTTAALGIDVPALLAGITPRTKLVVVGTPNNPTGTVITRAQMQELLAGMPARALLIIDEAYCEYAAAYPEIDHADGLAFLGDPRVVVLRTFSKIYGLAGLRVGYAVGDPAVIDLLGRVTRTFHVSSLAQAGAVAALGDVDHVAASARHSRWALEQLRSQLGERGIRVLPSLANFELIDVGARAPQAYQQLLARGVIVRPMAAWGLPSYLRVSAPSAAELPVVVAAITAVLGG